MASTTLHMTEKHQERALSLMRREETGRHVMPGKIGQRHKAK